MVKLRPHRNFNNRFLPVQGMVQGVWIQFADVCYCHILKPFVNSVSRISPTSNLHLIKVSFWHKCHCPDYPQQILASRISAEEFSEVDFLCLSLHICQEQYKVLILDAKTFTSSNEFHTSLLSMMGKSDGLQKIVRF